MKRLMQRFVSAKPGQQVFLRQHTVLTQWRGQTVGGVTEGVGSGQLVLGSVKEKGGASTDTPPYLFYPNVLLFYTLPGCHHILRVPELEAMIDEPKRRLLNIGHRGLHAVRNRNNGNAVPVRVVDQRADDGDDLLHGADISRFGVFAIRIAEVLLHIDDDQRGVLRIQMPFPHRCSSNAADAWCA